MHESTNFTHMVSALARWQLVWNTPDSVEEIGEELRMNDILSSKVAPKIAMKGHTDVRHKACDWRKSMSDHVAFALLVYTSLQIFMTVHAMKEGSTSVMPYFVLVVLVAGIIPACRWFERRWRDLSDEDAADKSLLGAFRRDIIALWIMAIGFPFLLTGAWKVFAA